MTTLRASLSVGLLVGFFVFCVGIVVGLIALAVLAGGTAGAKGVVLAVAVAAALGQALWQVLRHQAAPPSGVLVREEQAPALFAHVRQLAAQVATRPPDEIRLVPDVNAAVQEDTRWLGLQPGIRRMYIGVPLLMTLTIDQMRAVLAHELGHYSHSHTRLGEITYKGRATIIRTVMNIGPKKPAGYLLRGYLWLYLLVSEAVSRQQELEADRAAARAAGRTAMMSALQEIEVVDAAWSFYLRQYVVAGVERGYFPDRMFGGFHELVAARAGELTDLRRQGPRGTTSKWDSHPATPVRIAAIAREPEHPVPVDGRPAALTVADMGNLVRQVEAQAFDVAGRRVLPWPQFTAATVTELYQEDADVLYRAAARVAGLPAAGLGVVFDLLAAGRGADLVTALTRADVHDPDGWRDGVAALAGSIARAVEVTAVRSGAAHLRHSWSGPVELVTPDGRPMEFGEAVAGAIANPSAVPALRAALTRLGIDESRGAQVEVRATGRTADVVGAVSDVRVDGQRHDLVILDEGLVFVSLGKRGLASAGEGGEDRLRRLLSTTDAAALARFNAWLPYEDIAGVELRRKVPLAFTIRLHDGRVVELSLTLRGEQLGDSVEALGKLLTRFV